MMHTFNADYIVVGGGLTGCAMASLLSRNTRNLNVILIEAGPDATGAAETDTILNGFKLLGGELDYAYKSEATATTCNRIHTLRAGKVLGGGTMLNFGGWLRSDAADYDEWATLVGDTRWSYQGIKPWLEKAENVMKVDAISATVERRYPLRTVVADAWKEVGATGPKEKPEGVVNGLVELKENVRDGLRQPSYKAYPLDGARVITDAVVHQVMVQKKVATGVKLLDGREFVARKEVIICAGAYRTPQLLLLSGIGPADMLTKNQITSVHESPKVGANLHNHFALYLAFKLKSPSRGLALGSPGFSTPSFFNGLPNDWVISESLPGETRNAFEVFTVYGNPGLPGIPFDGTHIATSTMLLSPTSRGSITLNGTDPSQPPKIRPGYLETEDDQHAIVYAARRTIDAMLGTTAFENIIESETPPSGHPELEGLKQITTNSSDKELLERARRTGEQHHHSGGTAAMGSVVDAEGKVLGIQRLRIADASIIPAPMCGHPQATLYAMVEQIANMILEELEEKALQSP